MYRRLRVFIVFVIPWEYILAARLALQSIFILGQYVCKHNLCYLSNAVLGNDSSSVYCFFGPTQVSVDRLGVESEDWTMEACPRLVET